MDITAANRLGQLAENSGGAHVSLYMPTHRAGPETEQDPIRLKNLLRAAHEELVATGMRAPDAQDLLAPAEALLEDRDFWRHGGEGLAIFVARDQHHRFRLPLAVEELAIVAERFHIKPLLPLYADDGLFYILALSQNEVRLFKGTSRTVDQVELENVSKSLAEAMRYDQFRAQLQFHSSTASAGADRDAMFHGHGQDADEKDMLLRWFQAMDRALPDALATRRAPVVLAGVEYLFPIFREASSLPNLVQDGIAGNPEELSAEELHARAVELVRPIFTQGRRQAQARYRELAGTGLGVAQLEPVVLAAHHGRVETLFVPLGVQAWGICDLGENRVETHTEAQPGDQDLFDLAAVQTILNGGSVYAVQADEIPGEGPLAAILRY
jgi:hypothetical protein